MAIGPRPGTRGSSGRTALQAEINPDGLGVLPVTFRSPDGTVSAPAAAMVRPTLELAPYFRFGHEGLAAGIVHRPRRR